MKAYAKVSSKVAFKLERRHDFQSLQMKLCKALTMFLLHKCIVLTMYCHNTIVFVICTHEWESQSANQSQSLEEIVVTKCCVV